MFARETSFRFAPVSISLVLLVGGAACSNSETNLNQNTKSPASIPAAASPAATAPNNGAVAKVNLNTATQADLLRVMPNLGSRMLHEFEEYKPYRSIQQFRKEIGKYVDQTQVTEYEKFVFVPIDPNQADAPTLQQIPGVDASEAQELIAGRPYASSEAFIEKLKAKVSADELAVARTYLTQ